MTWEIFYRKHKIIPDHNSIPHVSLKSTKIKGIYIANSPRENTVYVHLDCQ